MSRDLSLLELIAHRGASADAPENTLAAFRLAWEQGADGIEGDFRLSSDGHIVCVHDADLQRTGGVSLSVAESTLDALRQVDVGSWFDPAFASERVPTLAEVLELVPDGKRLFIEVKCGDEIVEPLTHVLANASRGGRVAVISFSAEVIARCRREIPEVEAFWITAFEECESGLQPEVDEVLQTLEDLDASGLDCQAHPAFDESLARGLRSAGMGFHVWTVDTLELAQSFASLGVESLTTNRPGALRQEWEG